MTNYFSDREEEPKPRDVEEVSQTVWRGIQAHIRSLLENGVFASQYPRRCEDGGVYTSDETTFWEAAHLEIPDLPDNPAPEPPQTLAVVDFLEFCHRKVARPYDVEWHDYFKHHHWAFDVAPGQADFREWVNDILRRNGLVFEMNEQGEIHRLLNEPLRATIQDGITRTNDEQLDGFLRNAVDRISSPNPGERRQSLNDLFDAWERVKTLEDADKRASMDSLLEKGSPEPNFRVRLDGEARELTEIGNSFLIRHSETNQTPIESDLHIDYLFQRLFALIQLLLKSR